MRDFVISNVYAANRRYFILKENKQTIANCCLIYLSLKGKVAIGKARYLLNIVYLTLGCSTHLFSDPKDTALLLSRILAIHIPTPLLACLASPERRGGTPCNYDTRDPQPLPPGERARTSRGEGVL